MQEFTLSELGLFVGTLGGVITGLIFALQKSRCETINCCGIKCKRNITPTKKTGSPETPRTPKDEITNP
jgi:hypothetical protein